MKFSTLMVAVMAVLMTQQMQAQDFSAKQARPKAHVMKGIHSTTQLKAEVKKPTKLLLKVQKAKLEKEAKAAKIRKPFAEPAQTRQQIAGSKEKQVKTPLRPKDRSVRPLPFKVSTPLRTFRASGEVVDENGIITSPAPGTRKVYSRSGYAYINNDGFATIEQTGTIQIVTCDDGTVYVRNILSNYPTGAWVKGTREGNTITIPAKQPIYFNENAYVTFSIRWGVNDGIGFSNYDSYNNGNFTFVVDDEAQTMTLQDSSDEMFMGLFWDDDDAFAWQGDYQTVWTYANDYEPMSVNAFEVPAGLQTETWYFKGHTDVSDEVSLLHKGTVIIGFKDDDVYVKGLFEAYPDSWMKGKIDGTDVVFSGLQPLGDGETAVYAVGHDNGDLADFRMTYDADSHIMTATRELLANTDKENVVALVRFDDLIIQQSDPFAPIETLPYANNFDTKDEWDMFTIIDSNSDGSTWQRYISEGNGEASYRYNSDNNADDWLMTPAVRLEAGKTYSFSIDAHCSSNVYVERVEVKLGNAATAEAMTTSIVEVTELKSEIAETLGNKFVTVAETGNYYFGIHAVSDYDQASLRVDNLLISETVMTAPAAVTDLTVTADPETPIATIQFTAPSKTIGGNDLTGNMTKIELLRDGVVIKEFEDVAPATKLSYVDNDEELTGTIYRYQVIAYNADGQGDKSEVVSVRLNYVFDIPYIADFTQDAVGGQFTQINANDDNSRWEWDGGIHATYEYNSEIPADDYLVSPALHMEAGKRYNIVVDAGSAGFTERFEILVGREATAEGLNVKVLENCEVTLEDSKEFEATFAANETGAYYVAVHCISDPDMYELWINKVTVEFAPEGTAPAAPELTITPADKGVKQAVISIKAPEKDIDGADLTANLTKIELLRDGNIIKEFEDIAPGVTLSYTDEDIEMSGDYTYQVIPYNASGIGMKTEKTTVYVGVDVPMPVVSVKAVPQGDKVLLTWDKVIEEGRNGGYVDPAEVEYLVYACYPNSTYTDDVVETVKNGNSIELEFNTNEGDQGFQMWCVTARNEAGESYLDDDNGSQATVVTGAPYELPLIEGFAGGSLHYYWDSNSIPLTFGQSSDDDGVALALTALESGDIYLTSGKLNLKDATNPTLFFDAAGFGVNTVDVIGRIDGGDGLKLASETVTTSGYKNVKVSLDKLKDGSYAQVGITATITNPTVIDYWGDIEEEGDALIIDNIRIIDLLADNLSVELSAPSDVQAGKKATLTAVVTNWGEHAAKDYTVTFAFGDKELYTETVSDELAPFATKTFTTELAASVFDEAGDYTVKVEVEYAADLKTADNVDEKTVTISASDIPAPGSVTAENTDDGVTVSWTSPSAGDFEYTETFDDADVFTTFSVGGITASQHTGTIGEWTLYDGTGSVVYSWQDASISYDNKYQPSAFMPFDIAKAGFPNEVGHSGAQVMLSMCPATDDDGNIAAADHWLISPELPGIAQQISFYLRAITDQYGFESFEVLASKTDNNPESFELVESFFSDDIDWTEFTANLPEGTKYFAIRHTSTDIFGIMVDDVTFKYAGEVTSYNIYYEGTLVATVEGGVTTYTVPADQIEKGSHTFAVTAVYANGQESKPVTTTIEVTTGIEKVITDGKPVDVYTLDGRLVRSQAKSLDGLKGVYIINGKKYIKK